MGSWQRPWNFNPRTPCGVRPSERDARLEMLNISIHAPRVGCDCGSKCWSRSSRDFNPRTPCGVRPFFGHQAGIYGLFQSTHPVWGATGARLCHADPGRISIHAPRVGCDLYTLEKVTCPFLFQSTHPVWGATRARRKCSGTSWNFNPRTPCGVRPGVDYFRGVSNLIAIHAPRVGCDG